MASLPPIDVPTGATGKGSFDAPSAAENRTVVSLRNRSGPVVTSSTTS